MRVLSRCAWEPEQAVQRVRAAAHLAHAAAAGALTVQARLELCAGMVTYASIKLMHDLLPSGCNLIVSHAASGASYCF